MFEDPVTLGDIANLIGLVGMVAAGALFVGRLGGKLDRLSDAIERLTLNLDDHEVRIRELERQC